MFGSTPFTAHLAIDCLLVGDGFDLQHPGRFILRVHVLGDNPCALRARLLIEIGFHPRSQVTRFSLVKIY